MRTTRTTIVTYPYTSSTRELNIPFDYLRRDFVIVTLNGIGKPQIRLTVNVDYKFSSKNSITVLKPYVDDSDYKFITIQRITDATKLIVNFQDGSILNANELNISQIQSTHVAEEARDLSSYSLGIDTNGNLNAYYRRIINLGDPIDLHDAVNKAYVDGAADGVVSYRDEALQYRNETREIAGALKGLISGFKGDGVSFKSFKTETRVNLPQEKLAKYPQGFAISDDFMYIRCGESGEGFSSEELSVIVKIPLLSKNPITIDESRVEYSKPMKLGHQGLGVFKRKNKDTLVGSTNPKSNDQNNDGKGVKFFTWDDSYSKEVQLFGDTDSDHRYRYYKGGTPAISQDGTKLGILTTKLNEHGHSIVFIYDLKTVLDTSNGLDVYPLNIITFKRPTSDGCQAAQSLAFNDKYIYISYGYYPAQSPNIIGVYTMQGELVRLIHKNGVKHTKGTIVDDITCEPEGLLLMEDNTLLSLEISANADCSSLPSTSFVTFEDELFMPIRSKNIGKSPLLPDYWLSLGKHSSYDGSYQQWSTSQEYATPRKIHNGYSIIRVSYDDLNRPDSREAKRALGSDKQRIQGSLSTIPSSVDIAYKYGDSFQIKAYSDVLNKHYETITVETLPTGTKLRLYDNTPLSKNSSFFGIEYRYGEDTTLIRHDRSAANGAGLNLHGMRKGKQGIITMQTGGKDRFTFNHVGGIIGSYGNASSQWYAGPNEDSTIFILRADMAVSKGSGINLYRKADGDKIIMFTGGTERLEIDKAGSLWGSYGTESEALGRWLVGPNNSIGAMQIRADTKLSQGAGINLYKKDFDDKILLYTGGKTSVVVDKAGNVLPDHTLQNLGSTSKPWDKIYSKDGTIQTSDARLKTHIRPISDDVLRAWEKVSLVSYKWIDSEERKGLDARTHIGILAQCIINAFEEEGLNAFNYGIVCHEKWDDEEPCYEEGALITERVKGGDKYMVRMDQCLYLEAECNRRKLKQMEERLTLLEEKLNA